MKLGIFDCDGVLVDSETIGNEVLARCVTRIGWTMSTADSLREFKGRSFPDILKRLQEELSSVPEDFSETFRAEQLNELKRRVRAVDGVKETLRAVTKAGKVLAVASNGPRIKVNTTLGATGMLSAFGENIFTRELVERPKPFPDLFLYVASTLGFAPEEVTVVEDSKLGVQAAKAANMRCVGFYGTPTANADELRRAGADALAADMREVEALILG